MKKWINWTLFFAVVTVIYLGFALNVMGQENGHDMYHSIYKTWVDKDGNDCCGGEDCAPADIKSTKDGFAFRYNLKWCDLPKEKQIFPINSPPGTHVCHNKYPTNGCPTVYCWRGGAMY